ncbi:MAG: hypothetical protein FRX48_02405 [Lasallia pustulata]|uniref:Uncharacterized protein n=1 Tax=Lasallia pustulata TaxID=136370 RepID=A0A5M8PWJ4_9LECA|nr:MAG: hypothetical protein FRX48_02405 [Lasallia pustulata]
MASNLGPIAVNAFKTRRHLQELCLDITNRTQSDAIPERVTADAQDLADCLGRFNIWVGGLGVFQNGEASLDFRISTEGLAQEVLRLLGQLDFFTSELKTLVDGSREQRTWTGESLYISREEFSDSEDISDDDTDGNLTPENDHNEGDHDIITESRDLHLSINEPITSLLRLSVQLHKSSRKAKFAKSSANNDFPIEPDVSHVRDFFPYASGNGILVRRLGKANAQRRQWLWYRRRHREKLSVDFSGPVEERMPWFRPIECSNIGSIAMLSDDDRLSPSLPSLSGTNATTFRSRVSASLDITSQSDAPGTVFGAIF